MSDPLLEWMSYRREGRLVDIPNELTGGAPRRLLDDISMLGHAEMPNFSTWRIVTPVLAGLPAHESCPQRAVLCGARTRGILDRVTNASHACGAHLEIKSNGIRPSLIRIECSSMATLADVAARADIPLQNDAGYTLLACLPTIREWPRTPCSMVVGRVEIVQRFSRSKLKWMSSSLQEATDARKGFFRVTRDWDRVSILKSSVTQCAYIDDRVGRLSVASKQRVASWNSSTKEFGLPFALMPPAIIARALTISTGILPEYDRTVRRVLFRNVTPAMLRLMLSITGVRLA